MTDRLLTIYVAMIAGIPAILTLLVALIIRNKQQETTTKIVEVHDMVNGRLSELLQSLTDQYHTSKELYGIQERAAGVIEGNAENKAREKK